jgi:hypothetical protein
MPPQQRRQGNQGKEEIIEAVLDEVLQAFRTEDVPREIASLAARKLTSLRAPLLTMTSVFPWRPQILISRQPFLHMAWSSGACSSPQSSGAEVAH